MEAVAPGAVGEPVDGVLAAELDEAVRPQHGVARRVVGRRLGDEPAQAEPALDRGRSAWAMARRAAVVATPRPRALGKSW